MIVDQILAFREICPELCKSLAESYANALMDRMELFKNLESRKENYMKKSDLKDGMKVYLQNGDRMLVIGSNLVDIDKNGYIMLSSYDENLKYRKVMGYDEKRDKQWEIVKVLVYDYGWENVSLKPDKVEKTRVVALETFVVKVILEGDKTTVLLPNGCEGSTIRVDPEVYNEETGIQVALLKAQIRNLEGELRGFRD